MRQTIFLVLIYVIFVSMSYLLFKRILKSKSKLFYGVVASYFVGTYLYFELINLIHVELRERGYYIDLGHSSLSLLLLMLLSLLTGLGFVVIAIRARTGSG